MKAVEYKSSYDTWAVAMIVLTKREVGRDGFEFILSRKECLRIGRKLLDIARIKRTSR